MNTKTTTAAAVLALAMLAAAGCTSQAAAPKTTASPSQSSTSSAAATPNASAAFSAQPLPTTSPGPYPVALPSPATVDRQDPTATAQAAAVIMWSTDMATDASQYQAELRSAWLLAPAYLASIKAHPPVAAPGAWWNECAAHHAYTTVTATPERQDQPSDTAISAVRQFGLTITPHGTAGWTGPVQTDTVFIQLTRTEQGAPWAVSAVELSN